MEELLGGMGGGGGKIATSKAESDSANNFGNYTEGGGNVPPIIVLGFVFFACVTFCAALWLLVTSKRNS